MESGGTLLSNLVSEGELAVARRLKARDPQALSDAYDLYGRIVYRLIFRIVRDVSLAEDLVQETFLRVWDRADQINNEHGVVGPWLLAIARHSALDTLKSARNRFMKRKPISDFDLPPITIDREIILSEQARMLHNAFRELTPPQRQVIELAYFEGLSQQQIAERLQQPLGTIKGRTRLALQRLRSTMGVGVLEAG